MNQYAPLARIILRYVSSFVGATSLASDQDAIAVVCLVIAGLVEAAYAYAKRKGGAT